MNAPTVTAIGSNTTQRESTIVERWAGGCRPTVPASFSHLSGSGRDGADRLVGIEPRPRPSRPAFGSGSDRRSPHPAMARIGR